MRRMLARPKSSSIHSASTPSKTHFQTHNTKSDPSLKTHSTTRENTSSSHNASTQRRSNNNYNNPCLRCTTLVTHFSLLPRQHTHADTRRHHPHPARDSGPRAFIVQPDPRPACALYPRVVRRSVAPHLPLQHPFCAVGCSLRAAVAVMVAMGWAVSAAVPLFRTAATHPHTPMYRPSCPRCCARETLIHRVRHMPRLSQPTADETKPLFARLCVCSEN